MKSVLGLVLLMASVACGQDFPPVSTAPVCANYAPHEKHFPNVPECAAAKTQWPKVVSMQGILDSVQAKLPGNEGIKPCGPKNHDDWCVDASLPHIRNHLYITQDHCEKRERVKCTHDQQYFAPIGKPVFEETTEQ